MSEPTQDVALEFATQVGKTRDGKYAVSLVITIAGIGTFGVALPPDFARVVGPELSKELSNAADAADEEARKEHGLQVVRDLPDGLKRKGH